MEDLLAKQISILNVHTMNQLYDQFQCSFYLLDVEKLRNNYQKMETAFKSRYDNFVIAYSYKTNYLPYLSKELMRLGAYAEVVSRLEYDLAIKIGVDPQRIIFNGPLKSENDIGEALNHGSIVNIDSTYEVDYVKKHCEKNSEKQFQIGIRVNFDLANGGESPLQEGYELSRFGICSENGNLEKVILELKKIENLRIIGLHGHFSTKHRSVQNYELITRKLCYYAKQYLKDEIQFIDVGGGFYGELPKSFGINSPSFDDYALAICTVMNEAFKMEKHKPALIIEPGMAMVANTFSFFAKVIENKKIQDQHLVLVDGSVHNVKPTMHKRNLPMTIIPQEVSSRNIQEAYHIVGYTCMEKDYLAHDLYGLIPQAGDFIQFENVGAYTIVFNPPFIKERPSIFAKDGDEIFAVRKKESLQHFFNEEIYCF